MPITHIKVSPFSNQGSNSLVQPSDWNANHAIAGVLDLTTAQSVLGVALAFIGVPTGSCAPTQLAVNVSNGNLYSCVSGTWVAVDSNPGVTQTIASGPAALGTAPIGSGTCATTVTVVAAGVAATDNIMADFNASPLAVTGYAPTTTGILTIVKWPTAGNVNFAVCNNTSGSITPGAVTLNWRVVR